MALSKNCIDIIKNGLNKIRQQRGQELIDDAYVVKQFQADFDDLDLRLNQEGIRFTDPIKKNGEVVKDAEGNVKTHQDEFVENVVNHNDSDMLENLELNKLDYIKGIQTMQKIDNLANFLSERDPTKGFLNDPLSILPFRKAKTYTDKEQLNRASQALLLNTNDVVGHVPLELIIKNGQKTMIANFQRGLDDSGVLKGERFENWIQSKKNDADMSNEFYTMNEEFRTNVNQVTDNDQAYKVAQIFFDTVVRDSAADLKIMGRKTGIATKTRMAARFDYQKVIKESTRQEFRDFMIDKVRRYKIKQSDGDIDITEEIIDVVYETINNKDQGWRKVNKNVGDRIREYYGENYKLLKQDGNIKTHLSFIDGEARQKVVNQYTNYNTGALEFMGTILENARERGMTQFFGPRYERVFGQLKKQLTVGERVDGKKIGGLLGENFSQLDTFQKRVARSVFGFVDATYVNPAYGETDKFASTMSALRNVQNISKLGSAIVTSILDTPTFTYAGKRLFGLDIDELIAGITKTNKFKGTQAQVEMHRRFALDAMTGLQNKVGERFGAVDSLGAYSKFEKGSAEYAKVIFKLSGLTWWTESLQSAAANVYARSLGIHVTKRTAWNKLNKNFRSQLKRYGVTEEDWSFMLKKRPLNEDGMFDMNHLRQIEDQDFDSVKLRKRLGTDSVFQKMQAVMNDAVDTMVIKPGDFDILATSLFPEEFAGAGSQIAKMLTQFKTHPITYYRKIIARRFLKRKLTDDFAFDQPNKQLVENVADIAVITGLMVTVGALVVQLKQAVAGKQGYKFDSPTLWARAATTSGAFGILSDMFLQLGGEDTIAQMISPNKEPIRTTSQTLEQFLGPMIVDIGKLLDNFRKMGIGAIREGKGLDDGELIAKGFSNITKFALDTAGFKNLVQTKALYRIFLTEYLTEFMDPDGYYRTQSRLDNEAFNERLGGKKNITQIQDITSTLTFGALN